MFGFLKPNVRMQSGLVPPIKFDANSIRVDTTPIKARVISVQPAGILGRAWHMASKDFLGNVGATVGTVAANVVLDKSLDYLIRSLPFLVRYVGWSTSLVLSTVPWATRLIYSNSAGVITFLSRVSTWFSPAAVVANSTSIPTEIKHIIVDQTNRPDTLALIRKKVEQITAPSVSEPTPLSVNTTVVPEQTVLETVQKVAENAPSHGWLYYIGWAIAGIGLFSFGMKGLDYCITHYAFRGPLQPSNLSMTPIIKAEPTTYFDSFYYYVLQPFDQVAGIILYGAGFIWAGLLPHRPASSVKPVRDEDVELVDKRKFKNNAPAPIEKSGVAELPPEMQNATPTQKQEFLQSLIKNKKEIQLDKPITATSEHDKFITKSLKQLTPEQVEAITASPKYEEILDSSSEVIQTTFTEILSSPDRWEAIGRLFGAN